MISLAIAIVINQSPASGFTVDRDTLNSAPDLETGESKQLEVKYDLKTLDNNKTIFNNKTRGDSDSTVIAINNTNNNSDEKVNDQQRIVTKTDDTQTKKSGNNEFTSDTTMIISTETGSPAFMTTTPNTGEDLSTTFSTEASFTSDSEIEYLTNAIISVEEIQVNTTKTPEHQDNAGNVTSTATPDTSTASNYVNINVVDKVEDKMKSVTIVDSESKFTNQTDFSDQKPDQTNTNEGSTIATTDGYAHTTIPTEVKTVVISESAPTEGTTVFLNDGILTVDLFPPTLPPWKKYTTIDRKRTTTTDTATTEKDMTQAETAQTRISLEKALTNTPIPSLEKLRNDLINAQELTTRQIEITTGFETTVSNSSYSGTNISTTIMSTKVESEPTKVELVSRRAGYKDNRETTSAKPSEATATAFPTIVTTINETDMYGTMYETDVDLAKNKNISMKVYGSQSQLVSLVKYYTID